MTPSANLCRRQGAAELHRVEGAPLPNVRAIALKAAATWSMEANFAEKREHRPLGRADALRAARLACERLDPRAKAFTPRRSAPHKPSDNDNDAPPSVPVPHLIPWRRVA